ncbi:hypothetical protein N658DRAFT_108940 [Parathielavia hyrcaniae]|uniref:Uncharacterized protein n=1 Tax=Parathielavia hyrcaniae TaxID=113614 RepID=A0AAN6PYJ8_9PEZI|nr:hypothetical protein N658DRAFT_108940 [Parathielavia hyrcaniae]
MPRQQRLQNEKCFRTRQDHEQSRVGLTCDVVILTAENEWFRARLYETGSQIGRRVSPRRTSTRNRAVVLAPILLTVTWFVKGNVRCAPRPCSRRGSIVILEWKTEGQWLRPANSPDKSPDHSHYLTRPWQPGHGSLAQRMSRSGKTLTPPQSPGFLT